MSVLKLVETRGAKLKTPENNEVVTKPATATAVTAVTLSTYRLVRTGMCYPQVVEIAGRKADSTVEIVGRKLDSTVSPLLGDKAEVFAD